jgi:hypothetical protein
MDKLSNTTPKGVLPEFKKFFLAKIFEPEKNAPFYAIGSGSS